jgi:hypothetical protein
VTGRSPTGADLARALTGTWELVGWTIEYPPTDRSSEPFGPAPEGVLIYSVDGYMSAVMQRAGRTRWLRADPRAVSDAEKAAAFGSYLHYSGTWHVAQDCVIHQVRQALNPNLIGTRQVRRASLDGDALQLDAEEALEEPGRSRRHRILWCRAGTRSPLVR